MDLETWLAGVARNTNYDWGTLLAAAQGGDNHAYRAFLEAILPYARAIARRRAPSNDVAEDIVQDSLLTIHRVRHTYQPGRPVRPWLAAIVTRRAIDAARKRGRIGARETHDPIAYETFADEAANRGGQSAQSNAEVTRMMADLTSKQKEAVQLVKLNEMSLAEASAASGQSVAALKVNIHRALQRLRRGLLRHREESER
jgi:RNA polymerase sigma-70 factor (ECF subfamily)